VIVKHNGDELPKNLKKAYIVKQNTVKYLLDLALSSSSVKSMTLRSTLDLPGENTVGVFDCCLLLSCDV
jgi:hypothetical protein